MIDQAQLFQSSQGPCAVCASHLFFQKKTTKKLFCPAVVEAATIFRFAQSTSPQELVTRIKQAKNLPPKSLNIQQSQVCMNLRIQISSAASVVVNLEKFPHN